MGADPHEQEPARDTSLQVLTTVSDESIAGLICERLREEGVIALLGGSALGEDASSGGNRQVLVQVADLARAREILVAQEGAVSEEELIRAEEEDAAARRATGLEQPKSPDP
jgi:hypothetical protein